jgi:hypothetical protein
MAADKRSEKVAHTFYPYGYYSKFRDAGWQNKDKKQMEQQQEPGRADAILLPLPPHFPGRIFIEAKNGVGASHERFAFDQWNERQRLFAVACAYSGIPYWIFLMMGSEVGAKRFPLVAYLLTAERMFEIEWMAGGRKSLSYATALTLLTPLMWVTGEDRWAIPAAHPFNDVLRGSHGTRIGNPAVRGHGQGFSPRTPDPEPTLALVGAGA